MRTIVSKLHEKAMSNSWLFVILKQKMSTKDKATITGDQIREGIRVGFIRFVLNFRTGTFYKTALTISCKYEQSKTHTLYTKT